MGVISRKKLYEKIKRTKNMKYTNLLKYYERYFRLEKEKSKEGYEDKYFAYEEIE